MSDRAETLEALWEKLAQAIDAAGPEQEVLFLAKLALLLGRELQDARVDELIAQALADLK